MEIRSHFCIRDETSGKEKNDGRLYPVVNLRAVREKRSPACTWSVGI